ncbi:unnamed protein product [Polarella glacialis]|uniref:Uncharacterized protein n=1 Tax=Polarella glacialis TaxID=89957 RepID=A0A813GWC1_POLGL|nr:unnamed protein product [Polarella glacialis]CAE8628961.1 unnamed protein product [Polarella glacialis]
MQADTLLVFLPRVTSENGQKAAQKDRGKKAAKAAPPRRHHFGLGIAIGSSEAAAATGVRAAGRQLEAVLAAFNSFAEEAGTLTRAIQIVAGKVRLVATPGPSGPGPVHRALDEHPGATEQLLFRLIGRLERFSEDGLALVIKFDRQHLSSITSCQGALRLWLLRRDVGAPQALPAGERDQKPLIAARRLQELLEALQAQVQSWKLGLASCRYLGGSGGLLRLPDAPEKVDVEQALDRMRVLLEVCTARMPS